MKSIILSIAVSVVLIISGLSVKTSIIIAFGFFFFIQWIIEELNMIRDSHGHNIEELENKIDEIETEIKKIKSKDR